MWICKHVVALTSIFNFKRKIALERHHVTGTQSKIQLWVKWSLRYRLMTFKAFKEPAYAFWHFSHVILLSNPNFENFRETDLNFDAIAFAVPENPQKHIEILNWFLPWELGSSEFNLNMTVWTHYFWGIAADVLNVWKFMLLWVWYGNYIDTLSNRSNWIILVDNQKRWWTWISMSPLMSDAS